MTVNRTETSVRSLRDALALLETLPGQLVKTAVEVDPSAELSGVYRYAGGRNGAASDHGGRAGDGF